MISENGDFGSFILKRSVCHNKLQKKQVARKILKVRLSPRDLQTNWRAQAGLAGGRKRTLQSDLAEAAWIHTDSGGLRWNGNLTQTYLFNLMLLNI